MIRTGQEYRDSIRDRRDVHIDGERVRDVTTHPAFRPLVDLRAHVYDMQHDEAHRDILTWTENGQTNTICARLPVSQADWWAKRRATDRVLNELGGVVTRIGDDTLGEFWSLYDAADALAESEPQFAANIRAHIDRALHQDLFHISANTDPKGDRSKLRQDQDPDMSLHVLRETDAGIIVRGAKFETAAAYANLAYTKPTITNWGEAEQSDYAIGFICDQNTAGLKFICRSGFARSGTERDYPLANRFDEIEALVVFDDVLIPWENVLFLRSTRAARYIHATLHRYSAFAFIQRILKLADMLIGVALMNTRQTGLDRQQGVQEKLARLAVWREGINAHLTAAVALGEKSPGGLMMPNQSLLYAGRVLACSQLHEMIGLTRELCGGQLCMTPNASAFDAAETGPWLEKYYRLSDEWLAEDRRKLLAFARDLVSSDYAGHRLAFQIFAQSPPHAQLAAVYRNFDWEGPMAMVGQMAGLSDRVQGEATLTLGDSAVSKWYSTDWPRARRPRLDPD